jgi:UDP-glucose 4-epimerase
MKVLVLGGDGFIGSHVVDHLVQQEQEVTVFDRFPYHVSQNLEHQRGFIRFLGGEFANRADVARALRGQDVVFHFISNSNPADAWNDPYVEIEENLKYSCQLFELASDHGIKKIVFPSSGGTVYGQNRGLISECTLPRPFNPYGISKLAVEHFLNYYKESRSIASDIYRIGNAYGPRQPMERSQGVIAVWMSRILNGEAIFVYGGEDTIRDYIYADDIAYLMTYSLRDLSTSDVFNLGTGKGVSILGLLNIFRSVFGDSLRYTICPRRESDNHSVVLDSSKLLAHFPYFEFQDLEDKIRETWSFMKKTYGQP